MSGEKQLTQSGRHHWAVQDTGVAPLVIIASPALQSSECLLQKCLNITCALVTNLTMTALQHGDVSYLLAEAFYKARQHLEDKKQPFTSQMVKRLHVLH